MKNDRSESIENMIGQFVYRDSRNYVDEITNELKGISSLLWVLVVVAIINLFV